MEVLVIDNASTDNSVEMIEAKFPWVELLKSKENLGFAKGNKRVRGFLYAICKLNEIREWGTASPFMGEDAKT